MNVFLYELCDCLRSSVVVGLILIYWAPELPVDSFVSAGCILPCVVVVEKVVCFWCVVARKVFKAFPKIRWVSVHCC